MKEDASRLLPKIKEILQKATDYNVLVAKTREVGGLHSYPLHWAVVAEDQELAKQLLQLPWVDINTRDDGYNTLLHWAVQEGNIEMVGLLLNAGAKINVYNNKSSTPLHVAARAGHTKIVKLLLKKMQIYML